MTDENAKHTRRMMAHSTYRTNPCHKEFHIYIGSRMRLFNVTYEIKPSRFHDQ